MRKLERIDKSTFLDSLFHSKKSYGLYRISNGPKKTDPFEGKVNSDVWKISNNKLLRKRRIKNG